MTTIYLSSTFSDLKEYREAVYHALRQMGYDVIAMEDYVATDKRPLEKCLQDVAACELYVGLFAWRYGYVPSEENPEHKSITELEYRKASSSGKSRLIFLLDEGAPWLRKWMDDKTGDGNRGKCIATLRQELAKEKIVSSFQSPEHLASLVGPAVHLWEKEHPTIPNPSNIFILPRTTSAEQAERVARLKAMVADQSGFMRDRLASFVGRQAELAEIRQCIAKKMETGGYVTITGQAGQGKSSIIAKLVEEDGAENVAFHFIPLNPGPDHQVGLLRNLMARLILKYDLSDLYVASESRSALKDYFAKVLTEVVAQGGREVIFIDGLDQLEEDLTGVRDLSFLPTNPPLGVVFVLGTRPNDTLKPLELLKSRHEFQLPGLSREDFDLILTHRQVSLERALADQFYQVMQENALYLDLVAKELHEQGASSPQEMIARIADNPDNIFSLSMGRLKRSPTEWREVLKPVLGVLLAAREPLSLWQIRHILQLEDDRLRDGIARLGGLITDSEQDGQRRYTLFHLKLQGFLRQDEHHPQKEYIFATDEEQNWHAVFAAWCEQGQLSLIWKNTRDRGEQGRREYARRHYVTHLYAAQKWQQLFTVLDEGSYGQAKERYDLSRRSYIQDLDWGRQAATWSGWTVEEGLALLPCLWRYTLLRCSLRSRADQYPLVTFQLLLLLNREPEVVGLAELLTDPSSKVQVFLQIARHLTHLSTRGPESVQMFVRAYEATRTIEGSSERADALRELATALAQAQQWERAEGVACSIEDSSGRANALRGLAISLKMSNQELLLGVVQRSWLLAETREYAFQLLFLAHGLIALKPEISSGFLEAFRWVESFLNG